MRLSIIIPAYQEAGTISQVLKQVISIDTAALGFAKEIIVCDDGSTDGTAAQVAATAAQDPRVTLICHAHNRGKGAAIRTALAHATGDFVLIQDADLEYWVDDYPALLRPLLHGAPVVYGSRFLTTSRPAGMHWTHYLANKLLTWTANALYSLNLTDEATCFKVFRADLLRKLNLTCVGFEFCPEVTAKLGLRRVPIIEVPIRYRARSHREGKKVRWTDGLQALWVLLKHRLRRRPR